MRVLAVSVAPLYPDRIMGGSQRILMKTVDALAEAGHEVRLLAPDIQGAGNGFRTEHGASIEPVLELRGAFPAPYQTAPHRLRSVWAAFEGAAHWAERAYLHADAIYMRSALDDLPVVRSLHDFVYEEALLSAFTLPAERTIVPSQYMRDCIEASAGAVTDLGELTVVPNGIAPQTWPVEPRLPRGVGERRDDDLVLLHPHRLHREKGIEESIKIAAEVQARLPGRRVRLLVPALEPGRTGDDAVLATASIQDFARSLGAEGILELHEWLLPDRMPGYFAAGDATLCPGSFVEAFGLAPLESVTAGTPAVCSRVGALREHAGIEGITHFDFGDVTSAADAVVQAVSSLPVSETAATAVTARYNLREMRKAYVQAITGPLAGPVERSNNRRPGRASGKSTTWKLAPWCYVTGNRVYHDYLARFEIFPALVKPLIAEADISSETLTTEGERGELKRAEKLGFVVPV